MSKFIYRMQGILNIKKKMEDQARMEFAMAKRHLDEQEAILDTFYVRKAAYEQQGREARSSTLNILELKENKQAIARMEEYIETQRRQVERAAGLVEQARGRLQETMQERKTHEKLREKAFETFVKEENAKEGKETDERVSYTYGQLGNGQFGHGQLGQKRR